MTQELECELSTQTSILRAGQTADAERLEQMLQVERSKYGKLETEHSLLQRDAGKREVRCRGLQRDVIRLQAQLSSALGELESSHGDSKSQLAMLEEKERTIADLGLQVGERKREREREREPQTERARDREREKERERDDKRYIQID
jgi:hypothetical protein